MVGRVSSWERFTEGFETADVKTAEALIAMLR
jgi:hypothetical protein